MKLTNPRFFYLRLALAGVLLAASAALAFVATKSPTSPSGSRFVLKKGDPDRTGNKAALFGTRDYRAGDYNPAAEAFLIRAYPATDISTDASAAAVSGWASLNSAKHSSGSWNLIGPATANVPGVLNALGDAAPYITAGRVTAIALAPNCGKGQCRMYVAAAGGGIWRTDKALHDNPSQNWQFISGSFGTNAIGSLLIDPNNANIVYAATGEENASADSEAGVGIYKSTDGGDTWALLPGTGIFFQRSIGRLALDSAGNLLVPIGSGVRGVSSVSSGALSSGSAAHPLVTRGLYRCNGVSCTLIRPIVAVATARGSTTVKVDPTHAGVLYVNEFSRGVWRSMDNGATWTQIKTPLNAGLSTDRAEFDISTLPNGKTRMYVGVGNQSDAGANRARFYRTDDATAAAPVFVDMTTAQNIGYCTAQCWYDNFVYIPAGFPDIVYLGGSFSYAQLGGVSNGRAVLLSSDGGGTWSDQTQDGDASGAEFTHPDQHAIVTLPGSPYVYWEGSDGGLVSSDGAFSDVSYKCDSRGLSVADNALCKSLLNRVPHNLANNINRGFSTLQFQSLSVSPQHPKSILQGGTQDNGTWQSPNNNSANLPWNQIMYGDGGLSGFSVTNDAMRFNTFTGQANDANFQNGDPTKWVIISAPILSSPEGSYFYPPIIADPNPANAGSIYQGSFSVWRTQDWGGSQAFLEANCPEFTTSATQPGCGDFVVIGDGLPSTQLTDGSWGGRAGGAVAWIARTAQNTGTAWAATGAGRVFISDNISDPAAAVHWNRLDNSAANSPGRAISQIYVDPANANHGWVGYNGYNVNTPATPGHVFEVTRTGPSAATFTDISYNLPDFPITGVVRDDNTGDLYASSDFGVMKLPNSTTTWVVAGAGLPNVEVAGLTIVPSQRVLYAATHGRSAWSLGLP